MRRLVSFLRYSRPTQILLLRAFLIVVRVRIALAASSFNQVASWRPTRVAKSSHTPHQIARAVERVSRLVPGATCLTQAAAGHYLLARYGHPSHIRVGVKPEEGTRFSAHAWLLSGEAVVLGGEAGALSEYSVLTDLDPFATR
jgi:hypothetical protein